MKEKIEITLPENEEMLKKEQEKLYLLYLNCDGSPEAIRKLAKSKNISYKTFIKLISSYIDKYVEKSNYAIIFEKLHSLNINDEETIINYINSLNLPISFIENNLIPYIIKYRPDVLINYENIFLINLRKKINIYKYYLKTGKIQITNKTSNLENASNLITKFISSDFSKERFCLHERISQQVFKEKVAIIKVESNNIKRHNQEETKTLYDIYLNCLNKKDELFNNSIVDNVYEILNLIKQLDDEFCSIDLFMNTSFGVSEILKAVDNPDNPILNGEDVRIFRNYVSRYKKIQVLSQKAIENLLKEKTIINVNNQIIEVDNNIKLEIINFLDENNIPISLDSFRNACNRYYQEKLFSSKHR